MELQELQSLSLAARESDCSSCSSIDSSVPGHRCGYMASKSSGSSMHFKMSDDSDDPDWEEDADIIEEEDADLNDEEANLANDDPVPRHHPCDSVPERSPSRQRTRGSYPHRGTIGKGKGRGIKVEVKHDASLQHAKEEDFSDDSVPEHQHGKGRPKKEKRPKSPLLAQAHQNEDYRCIEGC